PSTKVIGLSKIPRLVDVFARRLQVQERLTNQIADTIRDKTAPLGVAVVMEATHLCMSMRGVEKQNSFCVTSAMHGGFRDSARTIVLLFGMLAIVAPLQVTGILARVVVWESRRVHHPAALLVAVVAASGLLSAIFVNDTICVAFTPLVLALASARRHNPVPYLLALATASNIGSTATIVGNPQNMLIGSVSRLGLWRFSDALA